MASMTPARAWSALDKHGPCAAGGLAWYLESSLRRTKIMCDVLVEVGVAERLDLGNPTVYRTKPVPTDKVQRSTYWREANTLWKQRRGNGSRA